MTLFTFSVMIGFDDAWGMSETTRSQMAWRRSVKKLAVCWTVGVVGLVGLR